MSLFGVLNLNKEFMDFTIGNPKKQYTRIIERPGLWMNPIELKKIHQDLKGTVEKLQIGGLDYGVIHGSQEAFNNSILTIIYDGTTQKPCAFNALSYMSCHLRGQTQNVVHLGLVVIDPTNRAKGLSWILYGLTTFLIFFRNRFKPIWISNVTQVPAIIGMVSESFGNVFPNPRDNNRKTFDHILLAREIMTKHRHVFGVGPDASFDEDFFVIQNAYTGGSDNLKKTLEQAPKHRKDIFNHFAKQTLDYDRGDDILQIGQIDVASFYHYMIHSVPTGSFLVVLYKLFFSFLESFVVPAVQWFSTSKPMGLLRPRGQKVKS